MSNRQSEGKIYWEGFLSCLLIPNKRRLHLCMAEMYGLEKGKVFLCAIKFAVVIFRLRCLIFFSYFSPFQEASNERILFAFTFGINGFLFFRNFPRFAMQQSIFRHWNLKFKSIFFTCLRAKECSSKEENLFLLF